VRLAVSAAAAAIHVHAIAIRSGFRLSGNGGSTCNLPGCAASVELRAFSNQTAVSGASAFHLADERTRAPTVHGRLAGVIGGAAPVRDLSQGLCSRPTLWCYGQAVGPDVSVLEGLAQAWYSQVWLSCSSPSTDWIQGRGGEKPGGSVQSSHRMGSRLHWQASIRLQCQAAQLAACVM
jgi:hypothetical protein